jgi:hypothetical protein
MVSTAGHRRMIRRAPVCPRPARPVTVSRSVLSLEPRVDPQELLPSVLHPHRAAEAWVFLSKIAASSGPAHGAGTISPDRLGFSAIAAGERSDSIIEVYAKVSRRRLSRPSR